jgi:hypothetical protein
MKAIMESITPYAKHGFKFKTKNIVRRGIPVTTVVAADYEEL